ncbi:MAG: hypothetical protein LBV41_03860 [Cytophagaceae bacterium]|nr:hypothetical protein [Cytophagaceae bacterium]
MSITFSTKSKSVGNISLTANKIPFLLDFANPIICYHFNIIDSGLIKNLYRSTDNGETWKTNNYDPDDRYNDLHYFGLNLLFNLFNKD